MLTGITAMPTNVQGQYERTSISTTTRMLLCVVAAGDSERILPRLDADWNQVFDGICRHGLVGLTYLYLNQHTEADYPPLEFRQQIQHAYRTVVLRMENLYRQINRVLARLANAGIDYLVVKGPALAHLAYPDPMLRPFNDLDLIVRECSWNAVHRALLEGEFFPDEDSPPQPPPKLVPQFSLYESKYWNRKTKFLVEVHHDDLYNTGLTSRDVDGFWRRAVSLRLGENECKVPSLEDQLIHACVHLHYHGYTRLNWFTDIAMIVRDHARQLNWDGIINTVRIEEIQVGVYYSLFFLERLLDIPVPRYALTALCPDRFRRWWHERYLPETRVLSLQPMSRPIFSFYFIPLLSRLLPDLLVMGRRREKLGYLLRLLFPPRDWLRYYYRLNETHIVSLHYILHPLKLAFHYLAEIATTIFPRRASV